MRATWCPDCFVGQWTCLYPFMELPTSAHLKILACLDGLSVTFLGQTSMELLQKPAPECALTPVPAFMASNGLEPWAPWATLQVGYMGTDLHPFAVRAAGLRTMIQQVVDVIRDGWAPVHSSVLERRAARDVVALRIPLAEAASFRIFASNLVRPGECGGPGERGEPVHMRIFQCNSCAEIFPVDPEVVSSLSIPWDCDICGIGVVLGPFPNAIPPPPEASAAGDLSAALVRPPSEASTAGDLSAARLRSLAARSKASGAATALVPHPPSVPPPDALLDAARSRSSSARQDGLEEAPDY